MINSKHVLSAGIAKLDYLQLKQTIQIAVGLAKVECERALGAAQTASFQMNHRELLSAAESLNRHAAQLQIAAQTLHVIHESETRETLTIINQKKNLSTTNL